MKTKIYSLLTLIILGFSVLAQSGAIDPTFNPLMPNTQTGADQLVRSLAEQPDGKLILVGDFSNFNGTVANRIVRINTDGTVDPTFNSGTGFDGAVYTVAIQSDGKILVGGEFYLYNGGNINNIVRLNSDGSIDNSFNIGSGFNSFVVSITIDDNGKILVGGNFTWNNGTTSSGIIRLNSNGTVDNTFNVGSGINIGDWNWINTMVVQNDGKILVSGYFSEFNGTQITGLVRLNSNGSVDATFNPGNMGLNPSTYDVISSIVILNDGKIIIGGSFNEYNGTSVSQNLLRLNSNGTIDNSYSLDSNLDVNYLNTILLRGEKLYLIGSTGFYNNGQLEKRGILRLNSNGTIDHTFNSSGSGFDPTNALGGYSLNNNKIAITGGFNSYNNSSNKDLVIINENGQLYSGHYSNYGFKGYVQNIAVQDDQNIIVVGGFTLYNEEKRNNIIRLKPNGNVDESFFIGTGFNNDAQCIKIDDSGKILVGGKFTNYNGTVKQGLIRLNQNGTVDNTFNQNGIGFGGYDNTINSIEIQNDGKILVGGDFGIYNGVNSRNIIRLNQDGSIDNTFDIGNGASGSVLSIAIDSDGKILVGGNFSQFNSTTVGNIVRLNPNGSIDNSFQMGTGFNGIIASIAIDENGKIIVGGWFDSYNNLTNYNIIRLNQDGTEDNTFYTGGGFDDIVTKVIADENNIYVGGIFDEYNGFTSPGVIKLNYDGSYDPNFIIGDGIETNYNTIWTIALQADKKLLIGGIFSVFDNVEKNNIVRLINCVPLNSIDEVYTCEPYTWIDGNVYTSDNNSATWSGLNSDGCQENITLNLIYGQDLNTQVGISGETLIALEDNATYQWIDCNNNNIILIGETNQSFSPSHSGSYAVILTSTMCNNSVTTSCYNVNVTDINDYNLVNFSIYPNPTENIINIQGEREIRSITLRDLSGKRIDIINPQSQFATLNLSPLSTGIYLIEIEDYNGNKQVSKVIRQ